MTKTQKTEGTNATARRTSGVVATPRGRAGAGNRHRANALPFAGVLQAKLTIGPANDPFEQEADRVANEIMSMPNGIPALSDYSGASTVQRKCGCGGATASAGCDKCRKKQISVQRCHSNSNKGTDVPPSVEQVLQSSGKSLDATSRQFMESSFGYDFSRVRIHTDSAAAQSARAMSALAFTVGSHIAFAQGQYAPGTVTGKRLLAHELAHVVQQGGAESKPRTNDGNQASRSSRTIEHAGSKGTGTIQRAGNPADVPTGFACPTDFIPGAPAGTDVPFPTGRSDITPTQDAILVPFVAAWTASGGTDDILVHGYASETGGQTDNWILSCNRAQNVQAALIALGIPAVRISIVAHGESTDFGATTNNEHAVISTTAGGVFPLIFGTLTPADPFAGRSFVRFGVGEQIALDFFSIPPRPAADFGGLTWVIAIGSGTLVADPLNGTGTYTAPGAADTVTLELRVALGATAGTVVDSHVISIVEPSAVNITHGAGAPSFQPGGVIPVGLWGAGFLGNVFVDPKDVSFQGVTFGEGTVPSVISGAFLAPLAGPHGVNTFGAAHGGNSVTGTPVSPPQDQIFSGSLAPTGSFFGFPTCGTGDFLWAIPWEFQVVGGVRTPFPGGFTANHHATSSFFCDATIEKAGAGPFCRRIDGTTC